VSIGKGVNVPFNFEDSAESFFGKDFLDEVFFSDEEKFIGNIKVDGEIVNDGLSLVIRGKISCCKQFICDRCLTSAEENQVHEFDEEVDKSDITDGMLDITELVRDTLIAAQPIKNLCKNDCKGLCPVCGKNLNDGECDCNKTKIDPRLAPMLKFKGIDGF
jgi:uncharacterized protein